MNCKALHMQP